MKRKSQKEIETDKKGLRKIKFSRQAMKEIRDELFKDKPLPTTSEMDAIRKEWI